MLNLVAFERHTARKKQLRKGDPSFLRGVLSDGVHRKVAVRQCACGAGNADLLVYGCKPAKCAAVCIFFTGLGQIGPADREVED